MHRPLLPSLVLIGIVACSTYTTVTWNPEVDPGPGAKFAAFAQAQLDSVRRADAEADALGRMSQGDSAFLAIQGFVTSIPGSSEEWKPLVRKHGMHVIVPECEVIHTAAHGQFCAVARQYAERYNSVVITRLRAQLP